MSRLLVEEENEMSDVKPCPFCGSTSVSTREGTTFRWWLAECNECGATAGEARRQTLGEGTNEEWDNQARADALERWNRRCG